MEIYQVVNPYTPDSGDTIYGTFDSYEKAQACLASLATDDNEYGAPQDADNCDINSYTVL